MKPTDNPCDFRKVCIDCLVYACCNEACDKLLNSIFSDNDREYKKELFHKNLYKPFAFERTDRINEKDYSMMKTNDMPNKLKNVRPILQAQFCNLCLVRACCDNACDDFLLYMIDNIQCSDDVKKIIHEVHI